MLASLVDAPLQGPGLVYEPKYDGIRAVAEIASRGATVKLWSRLGNDKSAQFPAIVAALQQWARRRTAPLVLDGEIVALDPEGRPAGFQHLQRGASDCAYICFDILRDGASDFRGRPLTERRQALERIFPPGLPSPKRRPRCASARSPTATVARCTSARSPKAGKA